MQTAWAVQKNTMSDNRTPLHVTSAPSLQTFGRWGWSRFCSAAVSSHNLLFPIAATLFSA